MAKFILELEPKTEADFQTLISLYAGLVASNQSVQKSDLSQHLSQCIEEELKNIYQSEWHSLKNQVLSQVGIATKVAKENEIKFELKV